MNPQQAELYRRVQSFRFDPEGSTYTFVQRLAKENGWSAEFAERVVEEYRRFAFLAAAAGHPVSPSDALDQAWHLHLVYTRSYWDEFCGEVLRTPLHHEPGTGGETERAKFGDWYGRTLASYRRFFGEDAPADVWPAPGTGARSAAPDYRRVDVARHWVVRKPRRRAGVVGAAMGVLVAAVALGCAGATDGGGPRAVSSFAGGLGFTLNPLDFHGPQFLAFYAAAFAAACGAAWAVRSAARGRAELPLRAQSLDPYQIAYLNGGAVLAVNAAVAALCHWEVLQASEGDPTLKVLRRAATFSHPLEQAVYLAVGGDGHKTRALVRDVRRAVRPTVDRVASGLRDAGLVLGDADARKAVALGLAVALLVPAVGLVKIFVGLSRNKPVTFLALACVAGVVVALCLFGRRPHRTGRGDAVLRALRSSQARLRGASGQAATDALAMGVAIFGMGFLGGTTLSFLEKELRPRDASASWTGSSSCGSSCGGGGGGSCGGGGSGGGGGCGGCGGGGD